MTEDFDPIAMREALNLTPKEVAEQVGYSHSYILRIEREPEFRRLRHRKAYESLKIAAAEVQS